MALFDNVEQVMSIESIASKLTYFQEQLHLNHWNTTNEAEHEALGELYEYVQDFKDDVIEKLMGYMGVRVKPYKLQPLAATDSKVIVQSLMDWAYKLYEWSEEQHYCDVENMAQELSGKAAKIKYKLTQS